MSVMKAKSVEQTTGSSPIEATVREYMPLVHQIARKYSRSRPDLYEDLVQVGAIGLLKSIQYYDPERTRVASLRTVASCYIKGEIRHYVRDHSSLVQVPRKFNEINAHLSALEESLARELGHTPTVSELSERSGYTVKEICDAQSSWDACAHYESFDHLEGEDDREDSRVLSELVPDKKYQDFVLAAEDRELITQALKGLGEKTRQIVEFVFFYDFSQKETAQKLGISEMGVSRAVHTALGKLKELLTKEIL